MKNRIFDIKKSLNELLFASYLFSFGLATFIIAFAKQYSFFILALPTASILLISLWHNYKYNHKTLNKYFLTILFSTLTVLLIDLLFRPNSFTLMYIYQFVIFGAIPLYLLTRVNNFSILFKFIAYYSIIIVLLYAADPFNGYYITNDYMKFGYTAMLPAYLGLYIGRKYVGMRRLLIFEITALLSLILFSNRGAFITAATFVLLSIALFDNLSIKRITMIIVVLLGSFLMFININTILNSSIRLLEANSLESYSLRSIYQSIEDGESPYSGRDLIWKNAESISIGSPIIGRGTGYFISRYNIYTHNIILEIFTSWGILGIFVFMGILASNVRILFLSHGATRLFVLLIIVMGIVPLLFSLTMFSWTYFWLSLYCYGIHRKNYQDNNFVRFNMSPLSIEGQLGKSL